MAPAGAASWKAGRLTKESELSKTVYNLFFKRNSSYVATIFSIAIVGGIAYDSVLTSMWNAHNKGVRARGPMPGSRAIWRLRAVIDLGEETRAAPRLNASQAAARVRV